MTINESQSGQRLDRVLATCEFISSRSRAAELIDKGFVTLGMRQMKASYRVNTGDVIAVVLPPPIPSTLQPLNAPLDLMFEDDDLAVLNKPSGLVVHPAAGHAQDTLVNILLYHIDHLAMGFGENRPGIVHRLDRDTSGILVIAKNDRAHRGLADQFRHKTAHRIYWALVQGVPRQPTGTIRSNLARHPSDRKKFASGAKGKAAVTHYKVLQSLPSGISWLQCKLETGRTHQIRVHLSEAGWPILGDPIYGNRGKRGAADLGRLALHASELGFQHPITLENMMFRVGWPEPLPQYIQELGFKNV